MTCWATALCTPCCWHTYVQHTQHRYLYHTCLQQGVVCLCIQRCETTYAHTTRTLACGTILSRGTGLYTGVRLYSDCMRCGLHIYTNLLRGGHRTESMVGCSTPRYRCLHALSGVSTGYSQGFCVLFHAYFWRKAEPCACVLRPDEA